MHTLTLCANSAMGADHVRVLIIYFVLICVRRALLMSPDTSTVVQYMDNNALHILGTAYYSKALCEAIMRLATMIDCEYVLDPFVEFDASKDYSAQLQHNLMAHR